MKKTQYRNNGRKTRNKRRNDTTIGTIRNKTENQEFR